MDFALSTSWNASRSENTKELLFEISQLGFKQVELGFNFTAAMVSQFADLAGSFDMRPVSLHNYCPIPDEFSRDKALPDCYSMASLDEFQRLQAVKYAKRTIDMASALGAKAVVLHCGRVEVVDRTRQLIVHLLRPDVMEPFGHESHVDLVHGACDDLAHFAVQDFTSYQF